MKTFLISIATIVALIAIFIFTPTKAPKSVEGFFQIYHQLEKPKSISDFKILEYFNPSMGDGYHEIYFKIEKNDLVKLIKDLSLYKHPKPVKSKLKVMELFGDSFKSYSRYNPEIKETQSYPFILLFHNLEMNEVVISYNG